MIKSRGLKVAGTGQPRLGLKSSFQLMQALFADLARGSGAQVISSASGTELSLESAEWKNGVFTFALLEGLKTGAADLDKNGVITVSELREYVTSRVRSLSAGAQTPTARRQSFDDDWGLFLRPR